jgi:Type I restriction enzyme R protein N terminus (HSDR_N)
MVVMPKRVSERLLRTVGRSQQLLKTAKDRDVNESDTVSIIRDMLAEVFGYDKHLDITSEFAIRGTYCDLAIKVDNKVEYLIEVKAIGLTLKEGHLRQAVDYGARNGVPWIVLTNGMVWQVYKIRFDQPITYDLVCSFDFSELDPKNMEHQERLFVICKEGLVKDAREEYHERVLTLNRFILGALILSDEVVAVMRRELRKLSDGVLVEPEDISRVLSNEVLKRDVVEGEEASKAHARVNKFYCKAARKSKQRASAQSTTDACQETEPLETPPSQNIQSSEETKSE